MSVIRWPLHQTKLAQRYAYEHRDCQNWENVWLTPIQIESCVLAYNNSFPSVLDIRDEYPFTSALYPKGMMWMRYVYNVYSTPHIKVKAFSCLIHEYFYFFMQLYPIITLFFNVLTAAAYRWANPQALHVEMIRSDGSQYKFLGWSWGKITISFSNYLQIWYGLDEGVFIGHGLCLAKYI